MEQEDKQALSIDAQIREMAEIATREGLTIVDIKDPLCPVQFLLYPVRAVHE